MNFEEALRIDLDKCFNNLNEFAKKSNVYYDGEDFENIPVVISGESKDRKTTVNDKAEGIFLEQLKAFIKLTDLNVIPRKNHNIQINDDEYSIKNVVCEFGEIILTLEAFDE